MSSRILQPCGTPAAYARGCRCRPCINAKHAYHRARRIGTPPDRFGPPPIRALPSARLWVGQAACAGQPTNLFFPSRGGDTTWAKTICADCPVKRECLAWALEADIGFGIWGGTSEVERQRLRRKFS